MTPGSSATSIVDATAKSGMSMCDTEAREHDSTGPDFGSIKPTAATTSMLDLPNERERYAHP